MDIIKYPQEFSIPANYIIYVNEDIQLFESLVQKTNYIQERSEEYLSEQINAQKCFVSNNNNNKSKRVFENNAWNCWNYPINTLKAINNKLINQEKSDILYIINNSIKRAGINLDRNSRGNIRLLSGAELF